MKKLEKLEINNSKDIEDCSLRLETLNVVIWEENVNPSHLHKILYNVNKSEREYQSDEAKILFSEDISTAYYFDIQEAHKNEEFIIGNRLECYNFMSYLESKFEKGENYRGLTYLNYNVSIEDDTWYVEGVLSKEKKKFEPESFTSSELRFLYLYAIDLYENNNNKLVLINGITDSIHPHYMPMVYEMLSGFNQSCNYFIYDAPGNLLDSLSSSSEVIYLHKAKSGKICPVKLPHRYTMDIGNGHQYTMRELYINKHIGNYFHYRLAQKRSDQGVINMPEYKRVKDMFNEALSHNSELDERIKATDQSKDNLNILLDAFDSDVLDLINGISPSDFKGWKLELEISTLEHMEIFIGNDNINLCRYREDTLIQSENDLPIGDINTILKIHDCITYGNIKV